MITFLFRYCIIFILEVCLSPGIYSYLNGGENDNAIETSTMPLLMRLFPEYKSIFSQPLRNSTYCAQFNGQCDACANEKGCGYCSEKNNMCLVFDYLHPMPKECSLFINFCMPPIHFSKPPETTHHRFRVPIFIILPLGGAKCGFIYWFCRRRRAREAQRLQNQCLESQIASNSTVPPQTNQVETENLGADGSTVKFADNTIPYSKF